jgi:outer membrane receptor protein involved in Fe transport
LYGANAFNGVINILTPPPKDIVGGKVSLAGGENNSARTDVRYAAVSEQWSYKFNVGRAQGDTWGVSRLSLPFEYQGLNPFLNSEVVGLSRNKVASTYGSGRVDYEFKDGATSTLEGGITQVENAVLVTGIGRIQVPKAVKPWGRINYNSGNLYVQTWAAGRKSIKPQVSLSTGLPLEEKSFVSQLDMQYRFSALQDKLFVILGGAHKYQSVDTEATVILGAHHDNTSGLYAQLEYELLDGVKSVFAARWDRSTLHSSQVSPKVALVWTPIAGHSFRASFNKAFQAPNYTELFLNVKHPIRNLAYFGNADLIVEKITGYELGYKGVVGDAVYVTVDGYYNQLKDFITDLVPNVNPKYPGQIVLPGENVLRTIWSYGNAGKVNEFGFEVSVNYYINKVVQLNANYSYFDFEVESKSENDVLLPNAPEHKVNGGITYATNQYQISMSVKYVPTFEWAAGIFRGDILAYTLVNLEATYRINSLIELGLNVTNLLNREHYQIFGGSLIGRRAIFSMTATI